MLTRKFFYLNLALGLLLISVSFWPETGVADDAENPVEPGIVCFVDFEHDCATLVNGQSGCKPLVVNGVVSCTDTVPQFRAVGNECRSIFWPNPVQPPGDIIGY